MEEEKQLLKRIQNGDSDSFSILIDAYKQRVFYQALQMVGNKQDAEEVVQDAFIKTFKSIKQFRGESAFSTWLFKIVHFTALSHLRKRKPSTGPDELEHLQSENSVMTSLQENDKKKFIRKVLNELKPIDRNLIVLFYLEEKSIKEIEEITLLSTSNIKVKLMRVKKQLHALLSKELKEEALIL